MNKQSTGHDVIVIGASAGGLEPLRDLVRGLPPDLGASVFAVLHIGTTSYLTDILRGAARIGVELARSGEEIQRGKVYIAGPGAHLLLHDGHILVRRGPRENLARPAIDPLFRSAAVAFGGRVTGVLLSGLLDDGVAGLRAIKRCGGLTVVQDPKDAAYPDMPRNALRHAEIDHVAASAGMPALLISLVDEPAAPTPEIPEDIRLETAIAALELADMEVEEKLGKISRLTCPECHGAMWEIEDGSLLRYRCHVGHAFTASTVLASKSEEAEHLVGRLLRAHQERAALARRMAETARSRQEHSLVQRLDERARDYEEDARLMRRLIESQALRGRTPADGGNKEKMDERTV